MQQPGCPISPVVVQFWILTRPHLIGVIPSGAVLQAKRGISRGVPTPSESKLHHYHFSRSLRESLP